jgi:hypothetical protein
MHIPFPIPILQVAANRALTSQAEAHACTSLLRLALSAWREGAREVQRRRLKGQVAELHSRWGGGIGEELDPPEPHTHTHTRTHTHTHTHLFLVSQEAFPVPLHRRLALRSDLRRQVPPIRMPGAAHAFRGHGPGAGWERVQGVEGEC